MSWDAVFPVFHTLSTQSKHKLVTSVSVSKRVGPEILALACVLLHIGKSLKIKPLPSRSHKQLLASDPNLWSLVIFMLALVVKCACILCDLLLEDVKIPKRISLAFFVAYTYFSIRFISQHLKIILTHRHLLDYCQNI